MISAPPAPQLTIPTHPGGGRGNVVVIVLAVLSIIVCVAVFLGMRYWPFEQKEVIEDLAESSDSQVQVRTFRKTYFPYPGCVVEGLVFVHGTHSAKPLITIERLTVQGTYSGLLSRTVRRMGVEGMRIVIPPFGTAEPFYTTPTTISIAEIDVTDLWQRATLGVVSISDFERSVRRSHASLISCSSSCMAIPRS